MLCASARTPVQLWTDTFRTWLHGSEAGDEMGSFHDYLGAKGMVARTTAMTSWLDDSPPPW